MLELGRPLHVYDLDKLRGAIEVRWGRKGEKVLLLNEQTVAVDPTVVCITDESGVIGLGGIMGGETTKADSGTRNLFLESAFFWPDAIMGRSRRYGFTSDAGHRFERGVDFNNNVDGIERATRLILDICGGEPGPTEDLVAKLPERKPVRMRVARAQKIIGMQVPAQEMQRSFERLALPAERDADAFVVQPPSYRYDLAIEEDLVEEVARLYGYERISAHPPRPAATFPRLAAKRSLHELRARLAAADYHEVINFSFVEERWEQELAGNADPIRVLNPIAAPLAVMRSSLLGSLVNVLRYNLARKAPRVRVFEIGRVFQRDAAVTDSDTSVAGVRQPRRLAGLAFGSEHELQWGQRERAVDFFDAKGDVEALLAPLKPRFVADTHPALHPGRSARVEIDGVSVGWIGELHPRWRQAYELPQAPVLFELDLDALLQRPVPEFKPIPRQQSAVRDVALVAREDLGHDALMSVILDDDSALVRSAKLFDLYKPATPVAGIEADERSLAVRVELLDPEATLTDERIDAAVAALLQRLQQRLGVRLRG
jgi:phenylalanyl-tRNA synthetase beta chain